MNLLEFIFLESPMLMLVLLWHLFVDMLKINLNVITDAEDFQPIAPVVKAQPLKGNWEDEDVEEDDIKESWEEEEEEVLRRFAAFI